MILSTRAEVALVATMLSIGGTAVAVNAATPATVPTRILAAQPAANVWRLADEECTNRLDAAGAVRSVVLDQTRTADGGTVIVRCTRTHAGVTVTIRVARPGETLR